MTDTANERFINKPLGIWFKLFWESARIIAPLQPIGDRLECKLVVHFETGEVSLAPHFSEVVLDAS
jgi:hypothetical protein